MNFDSTQLSALLLFALVSSITPGPNNTMLLASGVNFGFLRSLPHMLGISCGFALLILTVGLGLGALFERVPVLHTVLRYVGAAYLLWLAWKMARAAPPDARGDGNARPLGFLGAAAFQWVNPKAWVMAFGAITAYLPDQSVRSVVIVTLVFALVNLPSVGLWTGCGTMLRSLLQNPVRLRRFNLLMALLLVASLYPMLAAPVRGAAG